MDEQKAFEHFLEELPAIESTIEENKKNQKMYIKQLRRFIQSESPDLKRIDELPFPVALFQWNGVLTNANMVLTQAAGITASDLAKGHINFLNRITTENEGVLNAAERAFKGETSIVKNLVAPIFMFLRDDHLLDCNDVYQTALFFPVDSNKKEITHGAVVLMKQRFD